MKIQNSLKNIEWFYFLGSLFYGASVCLLYRIDELRAFPTFSIAFAALYFSYLAYKYSREKFRLDLFEQRYEIYTHIVTFCSSVTSNGVLYFKEGEDKRISESKVKGWKSAEESFRGLGYHKQKMLFGEDIQEVMESLNSCFAQLTTEGYKYEDSHDFPDEYKDWQKEKYRQMRVASNTLSKLPDYFKPYLYFGDYKQ